MTQNLPRGFTEKHLNDEQEKKKNQSPHEEVIYTKFTRLTPHRNLRSHYEDPR